MSDVTSSNEAAIDCALLEKVNPVFLTAKMTLFQLAANGDADAASLAENMGLTLEETQNSANSSTTGKWMPRITPRWKRRWPTSTVKSA